MNKIVGVVLVAVVAGFIGYAARRVSQIDPFVELEWELERDPMLDDVFGYGDVPHTGEMTEAIDS